MLLKWLMFIAGIVIETNVLTKYSTHDHSEKASHLQPYQKALIIYLDHSQY